MNMNKIKTLEVARKIRYGYNNEIKKGLKEIVRLGQLPANILDPESLAKIFERSEKIYHDSDKVGLRAVGGDKAWLGQTTLGGKEIPSGRIAVVGKGVTFDSGGISIKPGQGMKDMKFDMLGAATVYALSQFLEIDDDIMVHCVAPCAENTFHDNTLRPGDVLTYPNGVRVEVDNTDAEGRLILADGILEALKHKPNIIITIATLTGAARAAVGEATAILSNDIDLCKEFILHAKLQGEMIWKLPLWDVHRKAIDVTWDKKSKRKGAFISNCVSGQPGASTAAAFLEHFVDKTPWIHLDIAGSAYKDGLPTGAMFKTLVSFIESYLGE